MEQTKQYTNPSLEKVEPTFGNSFTYRLFEETNPNDKPTWHYHPEIELVFIESKSGKRHIGNHLSYYNNGELVMIGPNLPHLGFYNRLTGYESEVVVQFKEDFLGEAFFSNSELRDIKSLIERSKSGIAFHGRTKEEVGILLKDFNWVKIKFDQLIQLLKILQQLATSEEYTLLNADAGLSMVINPQDNDRMELIYDFVRANFEEKIMLQDIADSVALSIPSFCRYFKKMTNKTFSQFLMEFRIVHACKILSEEQIPITEVGFSCGFNNFSHFTKSFKRITGKSPSAYKKEIYKVINI